jgi:hypothetical protein
MLMGKIEGLDGPLAGACIRRPSDPAALAG